LGKHGKSEQILQYLVNNEDMNSERLLKNVDAKTQTKKIQA